MTVGAYLVGSVLGGLIMGTLFGALPDPSGMLPDRSLALLAAGLIALAVAVEVGLLPLPTPARQVNEDWLDEYRGWVIGLGFGFQLGLGLVTIVTSATVYLVPVMAWLSGSWERGALIGGAFGLIRALPILMASRVRSPGDLRSLHLRLGSLAGAARHVTVLAVVAVMLVVGWGP